MRWVIGITLLWFVIVNAANLKTFVSNRKHYNRANIVAAVLGLTGSVIGLAGLIFGWGI